jgi:hypothetical protein
MGWLNPKAPYNAILCHIKSKGIKVYHREMNNGADGLFDCKKIIITINKDIKYTYHGCAVLCHELQHFNDYRDGKFRKFFEEHLVESDLDLIIEAEMSAIKNSLKLLKMWGIKYSPRELTDEGFNESIEFWKKYYFT